MERGRCVLSGTPARDRWAMTRGPIGERAHAVASQAWPRRLRPAGGAPMRRHFEIAAPGSFQSLSSPALTPRSTAAGAMKGRCCLLNCRRARISRPAGSFSQFCLAARPFHRARRQACDRLHFARPSPRRRKARGGHAKAAEKFETGRSMRVAVEAAERLPALAPNGPAEARRRGLAHGPGLGERRVEALYDRKARRKAADPEFYRKEINRL